MKIIKGDNVKIVAGKDRGKNGKVLKVLPKDGKVLVEGLNMVKKNVKPKKQGEKGQTVSVPMPLNISNVMLICPGCGKGTRVGFAIEGEKKTRICRKCKARIG